MMEYVHSLRAALRVIEILQAVKTGSVDPDELESAIKKHFDLFKAAYGESEVRPKHHYALHLAAQLRLFGTLITTLTHERRHRLFKKYCRDRRNLQSWELGALEDITCHQIWEMQHEFFNTFGTSFPRGKIFHSLRDMFPGVADGDFTLHNGIKINGGSACVGNVVSFHFDGKVEVGQLLLNVGIESRVFSFIAIWRLITGRASTDASIAAYKVSGENVVKVIASDLDTVFYTQIV